MRCRLLLPFLALLLALPSLLACAGERVREPLPTMNFNLPAPTGTPAPPWAANAVKPAEPTAVPDPEPPAAANPAPPAADTANLLPEPRADQTSIPEVIINNDPLVLDRLPKEPELQPEQARPLNPTPAPEDICYRSPHIQDWILRQLNLSSCQVVNERELFRIQEPFSAAVPSLKPGDLAGLLNISALSLYQGHCGSWETPEYAAALLAGANPKAALWLEIQQPQPDLPWPQAQILSLGLYENIAAPAQARQHFDDLLIAMNDDQIAARLKQGAGIKRRLNQQAHQAAQTLAAARGQENPLIRLKSLGHAVIGADNAGPGSIQVFATLQRKDDIAPCPEPNAAMTLPGEK